MGGPSDGHGVFNHVVLVTCGLILLYVMAESLGPGYIITQAECDLKLTAVQKGYINAATFLGIVSTAIIWGYLGDRYGRRTVMLPAMVLSTIISLSSSFAFNFISMFILRFVTGCMASASGATVVAYLGEMHSNSHRAAAMTWGFLAIALTLIELPGIAWIIFSKPWSFTVGGIKIVSWRVYIWTWSFPGIMSVVLLAFLPESPRFLVAAKGPEAALPVLAFIYAVNNNKKKEEYPVDSIVIKQRQYFQLGFKVMMKNFGHLLRPPLFRCVVISHISMFMVFLLSSGLYTWIPNIFNELLHNIESRLGTCDLMLEKYNTRTFSVIMEKCQPTEIHYLLYPVLIALGIVSALLYLAIGFVIEKFGKIKIYCTVLGLCATLTAISSVLSQPKVILVLLIFGLSSITAGSMLATIAVEVFPTSVRALALCTLYMAGRLGAAVAANLLGYAVKGYCHTIMFTMALTSAASTLLMLFWPNPCEVRRIMEEKDFVY